MYPQTLPHELPAEERERRLVQASEAYMSGRLTVEQLEELERRYRHEYRRSAERLARPKLRQDLRLPRILRLIGLGGLLLVLGAILAGEEWGEQGSYYSSTRGSVR